MPTLPEFETVTDDQLLAKVRNIVARTNTVLADLLAHLAEVEARGIHRQRACASLYTYCVYELRMSASVKILIDMNLSRLRMYSLEHCGRCAGDRHRAHGMGA